MGEVALADGNMVGRRYQHPLPPSLSLPLYGLHSSTVASCFSNRLSKHPRLMSVPALGIVLLAILTEYCSTQVSYSHTRSRSRGEERGEWTVYNVVHCCSLSLQCLCLQWRLQALAAQGHQPQPEPGRCFLQYIFYSDSLCLALRSEVVPGVINQNSQSCHFSSILPHQTVWRVHSLKITMSLSSTNLTTNLSTVVPRLSDLIEIYKTDFYKNKSVCALERRTV